MTNIIKSDNQLLRTQSLPAIPGPETQRIIDECYATLNEAKNAVALSAIQLGYPIRLFVIKNDPYVKEVINPEILTMEETVVMEEGCLSFPGLFRFIERPETIVVSYTKQDGQMVTQRLSGLTARAFQHEYDHLNGKLFIDYPESIVNSVSREYV